MAIRDHPIVKWFICKGITKKRNGRRAKNLLIEKKRKKEKGSRTWKKEYCRVIKPEYYKGIKIEKGGRYSTNFNDEK